MPSNATPQPDPVAGPGMSTGNPDATSTGWASSGTLPTNHLNDSITALTDAVNKLRDTMGSGSGNTLLGGTRVGGSGKSSNGGGAKFGFNASADGGNANLNFGQQFMGGYGGGNAATTTRGPGGIGLPATAAAGFGAVVAATVKIGRASCRERV